MRSALYHRTIYAGLTLNPGARSAAHGSQISQLIVKKRKPFQVERWPARKRALEKAELDTVIEDIEPFA